MKSLCLVPLLLLIAGFPSAAAPRIVVSTPSLVPESEIDVIFSQPMVGQDALGKPVKNTLIITEPALPGKLFWKAPAIAEYQPDGIPGIGTEYRFSVTEGLKHLDGADVEAGEFGTVATEPLRILAANIPNRWSSDYSPSTGSWLIVFNDDVEPGSIAGFFGFSAENNRRDAPRFAYAKAAQAGYYRTNYLTWPNRTDPGKQREDVDPASPVRNIVMVSPNSPLPVAK